MFIFSLTMTVTNSSDEGIPSSSALAILARFVCLQYYLFTISQPVYVLVHYIIHIFFQSLPWKLRGWKIITFKYDN